MLKLNLVNYTKKSKKKDEEIIQEYIVKFLDAYYPDMLYKCDTNANAYLHGDAEQRMIAGAKLKRLGNKRGFPDIMIFESSKGFKGLFIELKARREDVYLKNGGYKKDKHILEQAEIIKKLNERGYYACFAVGHDGFIEAFHQYFGVDKKYNKLSSNNFKTELCQSQQKLKNK